MRHSLPVLSNEPDVVDRIEIPIPCHVSWADMTGDDRVRHCGSCRQNVYNIASFTRAEATRLLNDATGRVCLRIFRRPDGTVITNDCRARLRAARKRGLLIFAGALVVVLWAQICAQFVGLMGLKRLVGAGEHTMGAPVPIAVPGQIAPPPVIEMGAPPEPPLMGEIAPVKGRISVPKPPKHRLMGKPAMPSSEKRGGLEG